MSDSRGADRENRSLALKTRRSWPLGAFAFGFALVPLYDVLCDVTGFGNQKRLAERAVATERSPTEAALVTVDFVADLPSAGNWEFRPVLRSMQVHPGQLYDADFIARNLTGRATVAQAVPERGALQGRGLLPQDRVLLLHATGVRGERGARAADPLHRRSGAAAVRRPHHACLHFL